MKTKIRILHIDDNIHDRQLVKDTLQKEHDGFEVEEADSREKFELYLAKDDFDLVLSDFNILGFDGLQVLAVVKEKKPNLPVIIVTGTGSEEIAIQAMKMGASDYVIKTVHHIQGLVPTIKAVLEHKKIQEEREIALSALRESEERYRSIYENTGMAILLTSPNGDIFSANPAACKLFQKTEEEICKGGRNGLLDITDPRLPGLLEERKKTRKAKGELTLLKKDGSTFEAEVSSVTFIDKEKNEHTSMVIRDLTEQKLAENRLRTMGKAIEQSPASIIITDAKGNIEFVNAQFTSFMQYSSDEVIGKKPRIFNPGKNPEQEFETMWAILCEGKIWKGEFLNRKKDKTTFWENVIIAPLLNSDGAITNFILIMEDISEKKKMLNDLVIAKEKAEESDHLKTAFLQNISHEIRTPMNAIIGFSGFLNEPDLLPEKRRHYTEIIIQSANQLLSIITDIVSIATIEARQEKIREREVNLNSMFKLLYEQFLSKAQKQNVSLSHKTSLSDIDACIRTDKTKLTEIFSNLLNNALKFTKQGYINFGYTLKENDLEFYVEDTGIGISSEMHKEIFKRFRQVETTASRKFGGSGLGLSISKSYVELLGGKIWVNSQPGVGSVFYFTIPYKKAYPNDLSVRQPAHNVSIELKKPKTLLIAEDEDSNFILLRELLSKTEITILRATNGAEAVDICTLNPQIDLVLMDIKMPVMDGYEATLQIKKIRPDLPVIAQTAYTSHNDKKKAFESGCSDFINKPIKQQLLLSKIEEHIAKT